jgi:phage gpG-like protein
MARVEWYEKMMRKYLLNPAEKKVVAKGFKFANEVKRSMRIGEGRIYVREGKTRKGESQSTYSTIRIASAPGQPPAVDSGRLRASMSVNWTKSGMSKGKVDSKALEEDGVGNPGGTFLSLIGGKFTVVVGTNVNYAPYLEFGTSRIAARPFMRPVFDSFK